MDATLSSLALLALISVALIFDFLNGLHDAANSIATVVSTRVLRPQYAVMWAAFFNFIAFLFFGLHVAQTVGTGIVAADVVDAAVIFGALMGAICWNLITWWLGIPSSSSHALIGGLAGAAVTKAGLGSIVWSGLGITAAAIVFSPLLGFFLAVLLVLTVSWVFVRASPRPWTIPSAPCNSSRRRSTRWGMAAMTRRRQWASSQCCSTRKDCWVRLFTSRFGSS
jgi:PiT family inorganic phosphate transporter